MTFLQATFISTHILPTSALEGQVLFQSRMWKSVKEGGLLKYASAYTTIGSTQADETELSLSAICLTSPRHLNKKLEVLRNLVFCCGWLKDILLE